MPVSDPTLVGPPGASDFVKEYVREGVWRTKRLIGWTFLRPGVSGEYTWMLSGGKFAGATYNAAHFLARERASAQLQRIYRDPATFRYDPEDFG